MNPIPHKHRFRKKIGEGFIPVKNKPGETDRVTVWQCDEPECTATKRKTKRVK